MVYGVSPVEHTEIFAQLLEIVERNTCAIWGLVHLCVTRSSSDNLPFYLQTTIMLIACSL